MSSSRVVRTRAAAAAAAKLAELTGQVETALALLETETADGIIGEKTEEYDTLIQGANAVMAMNWAVMKTHGLRQSRPALKAGAQALTMVLQMVHFAYALGLRRGRAEGAGEQRSEGAEVPKAKAKPRSRPKVKPTG